MKDSEQAEKVYHATKAGGGVGGPPGKKLHDSKGEPLYQGIAPLPPKLSAYPNLKPGANPGGRARIAPLSRAIREQLMQPSPENPSITNAQAIAAALIAKARKGDQRCAETLLDRSEGKVSQKLTLETAQVAERFEKLSVAELERYASTGFLPDAPRELPPAPDAVVDAEFVEPVKEVTND